MCANFPQMSSPHNHEWPMAMEKEFFFLTCFDISVNFSYFSRKKLWTPFFDISVYNKNYPKVSNFIYKKNHSTCEWDRVVCDCHEYSQRLLVIHNCGCYFRWNFSKGTSQTAEICGRWNDNNLLHPHSSRYLGTRLRAHNFAQAIQKQETVVNWKIEAEVDNPSIHCKSINV